MEAKIDHADTAMQNAAKLIPQVANATSKKQSKPIVRKILTGLQQTMGVLSGAAEWDPRAKTAVTLFMGVLQLEIDRRDNDEEIVAVCYSMTSMVFVLRHLNSYVDHARELMDQLEEQMSRMSTTIQDFGAFADVYYTKCKSVIVRFCRASEFKAKMRDFVTQFQEYQSSIEFVLVVQMAGNQAALRDEVHQIKDSISTLIDHVGVPVGEKEKKAWEYIKTHGADVLETEDGQADVGKILQQSITSNTLQALTSALDDILESNSTLFELKLKGATMELTEAIDRSTNKILNRMDSDPHDLIDEPDVKEIWKGNEWKFSVKSRTFIDALCNYYTSKFAAHPAGEVPTDSWTLKILGKVINYPALGEAIDEDSSGFISVHEMNHFLKKNKEDLQVSTATWFAFWAVGPQYLNDRYTDAISEIMTDLEDLCRQLKSDVDHDDLNLCIDRYLETITVVKFIIEWSEYDDDVLDDMGFEREDLVRVADKLAVRDQAIIEEELNGIDYNLTDAAMLAPVTQQSGFRIEQSIMVLLYLILRKHHQIIVEGIQTMTRQSFASKWQTMADTLWVLVQEFHSRFKSLCRSWRSQKQDVELQVSCYAGGLFNGWHEEYVKSGSLIKKFLEDDDDADEEDVDKAPPSDSLDTKVDQLSKRVTALDTRLEIIEALLKQIVGQSTGALLAAHEQSTDTSVHNSGSQGYKGSNNTVNQGWQEHPDPLTEEYNSTGAREEDDTLKADEDPGNEYEHRESQEMDNEDGGQDPNDY